MANETQGFAGSILAQGLRQRQEEENQSARNRAEIMQTSNALGKGIAGIGNIVKEAQITASDRLPDAEQYFLARQAAKVNPNDKTLQELNSTISDILGLRQKIEAAQQGKDKSILGKLNNELRLKNASLKRMTPGKRVLTGMIQTGASEQDKLNKEEEFDKKLGADKGLTAKQYLDLVNDKKSMAMGLWEDKVKTIRAQAAKIEGIDPNAVDKNTSIAMADMVKTLINQAPNTDRGMQLVNGYINLINSDFAPAQKFDNISSEVVGSQIDNAINDAAIKLSQDGSDIGFLSAATAFANGILPVLNSAISGEDMKQTAKNAFINEMLSTMGIKGPLSKEEEKNILTVIDSSSNKMFQGVDPSMQVSAFKDKLEKPLKTYLGIDLPTGWFGGEIKNPEDFAEKLTKEFRSAIKPGSKLERAYTTTFFPRNYKNIVKEIEDGSGRYPLLAFRYSNIGTNKLNKQDINNLTFRGDNKRQFDAAREKILSLYKSEFISKNNSSSKDDTSTTKKRSR